MERVEPVARSSMILEMRALERSCGVNLKGRMGSSRCVSEFQLDDHDSAVIPNSAQMESEANRRMTSSHLDSGERESRNDERNFGPRQHPPASGKTR